MRADEIIIQNAPRIPDPNKVRTPEDMQKTIRDIAFATKQLWRDKTMLDNRIKYLEKQNERHWFHQIEVYNNNNSVVLPVTFQQDRDGDTGICMNTKQTNYWGLGIDQSQNVFKISPECPLSDNYYFAMNRSGQIRVNLGVYIDDFSDDETMADNSATALVTERAINTFVIANSHWDRNVAGYVFPRTAGDYVTTNGEGLHVGAVADPGNNLIVDNSVGIGEIAPVSLLEVWDDDAHPIISITAAHDTDYDPQMQYRTDAIDTVKFSHGVDSGDSDKWKLSPGAGVGGENEFVMTQTGYIGIGEDTPTALVHIDHGTAPNDTTLLIEKVERPGPDPAEPAYLSLHNRGNSNRTYMKYVIDNVESATNRYVVGCLNISGCALMFSINNFERVFTAGSSGIVFDDDDNVTIGGRNTTSDPYIRLRIIRGNVPAAPTPHIMHDGYNDDIYTLYRCNLAGGNQPRCLQGFYFNAANNERYKILPSDDITDENGISMIVGDVTATNIGYVGIGINTPTTILELWDDDFNTVLTLSAEHATNEAYIRFRTDDPLTEKWQVGVDANNNLFLAYVAGGGYVWIETSQAKALEIGNGTAATNYYVEFNGETANGIFRWMYDNDWFQFDDDIMMLNQERIYFDSADTYIGANADDPEDLVIAADQDILLEPDGDIRIETDSKYIYWGGGNDMRIGYDGTDGYIETDRTNPSDLNIDCGTDKTLELIETVYKDENLSGAILSRPVASQPDEVQFVDNVGANTGIYTWGFAVGEKLSGAWEFQHDYAEGTNIVFHIHWQGNDAPTGTDKVQWQLTYTVMQEGQTLDPATTITVETDIDTQYEGYRSDFAAITGTNFDIGDQFLFTIERIAASADEYGGDAVVATMGMHYQVNTLGSRQIGTK